MSNAFTVVQGDRARKIRFTLKDEEGAVDLTDLDGMISFDFQTATTGTPAFSASTDLDIIEPPSSGVVELQWNDGDVDVLGQYGGRIVVDYGDKTDSFPS